MLISFLFIILSFSFNLSRAAGGTTVVFLDHDDPAVHLSGDWTTDDDQASIGGSFAATTDVGATANVALPPGTTGLNYFGFRNAQGGLYATCVDCAGDNSQLQIFDANDPDTVGDAIPVVMISVSDLDPTVSHTLSVVNLPDLRFDNAGRLTLNALLVDIDDSAATPTPSSIPASATPVPTSSGATTASVAPSTTAGTSSQAGSSAPTSTSGSATATSGGTSSTASASSTAGGSSSGGASSGGASTGGPSSTGGTASGSPTSTGGAAAPTSSTSGGPTATGSSNPGGKTASASSTASSSNSSAPASRLATGTIAVIVIISLFGVLSLVLGAIVIYVTRARRLNRLRRLPEGDEAALRGGSPDSLAADSRDLDFDSRSMDFDTREMRYNEQDRSVLSFPFGIVPPAGTPETDAAVLGSRSSASATGASSGGMGDRSSTGSDESSASSQPARYSRYTRYDDPSLPPQRPVPAVAQPLPPTPWITRRMPPAE